MKTKNNAVRRLKEIFEKNKDKRICVLGASCIGKSTLIKAFPEALDFDQYIWARLSDEKREIIKSLSIAFTPEQFEAWTSEKKRIGVPEIIPGQPVFNAELLDCDLIVLLQLDDETYAEHVKKRGVERYLDIQLAHKAELSRAAKQSGLPVIEVDISENDMRKGV